MKLVIVLLSICAVGYMADHWRELSSGHASQPADPPRLIVYGRKSNGACVKLESELKQQNISHETRDLSDEANYHELSGDLARIGKMGGNVAIPVVEIDGMIIEGATFPEVMRRLH